jgi:CBS domain-containing protein
MDPRSRQVSHPILRLEVVGEGGAAQGSHRVFCRLRRQSVPLEVCTACFHSDAIKPGPTPTVECTVTLAPDQVTPDPRGDRTEVGALLSGGTVVVDQSASLREALRLMQASGRRSIAVVDDEQVLVGLVHETTLLDRAARPGSALASRLPPADGDATSMMSSALVVHEATPVRAALRLLASAHLREATVVTPDGRPIGVFRDVDGLQWLVHRAPAGAAPPAR